MSKLRVLFVGAHPADVLKRAGGTLIKYNEHGHKVYMATLTFGETMESNLLWKKTGMTVEKVKAIRKNEFMESAKILDVEPIMLNLGDNFSENPLREDKQKRIAEMIRVTRPHIIFTQWLMSLYDDHRLTAKSICCTAREFIMGASSCNSAREIAADPNKLIETGLDPWDIQDLPVYLFEPSDRYASPTGFIPNIYVDVSDVWEKKVEALKPFWKSQTNNFDYYRIVALYSGAQVNVKYAERFVEYKPKNLFELIPRSIKR